MALISLITNNEKWIVTVDSDPSASGGITAPVGSIALMEDGSNVGYLYLKVGALDTAWDKVSTAASSGVKLGNYKRIPIYDTPLNGYSVADVIQQNSNNIDIIIADQATRSAALEYTIPNPGDAITAASFVLTEGAQTVNGNKTFGNDVVVTGNLTVNGTLTYINTVDLTVKDKLITLNKGGAAASAGSSGIEFEENSVITGYIKTSADRTSFNFLAPAATNVFILKSSSLTADRTITLLDKTGYLPLQYDAALTTGSVVFASSDNLLTQDNANFFWDASNHRLGIGNAAPSTALHVTGSARITSLNAVQFVKSDANGNLSNAAVSLTADVSGILPIANGGTNSGTALNNGRVMISSGGAIVERAALTVSALVVGDATNGVASLSLGTANQIVGMNAGATANEYKTVNGTLNQVSVTHAANSITLSLPQNIHTGASPSFTGLTLSGLTAGSVIFAGTSGVISQDNDNFFWDDSNNRLGLGNKVPARQLDVTGTAIFRNDFRIDNNSANYEVKQAGVQTTNATATAIATIAITADTEVYIRAKIIGRKSAGAGLGNVGDGAVYVREARIKDIGGTTTIHNLQSSFTSEDLVILAWNGTIDISGNNARIMVTGSANNTVDWSVTYEIHVRS